MSSTDISTRAPQALHLLQQFLYSVYNYVAVETEVDSVGGSASSCDKLEVVKVEGCEFLWSKQIDSSLFLHKDWSHHSLDLKYILIRSQPDIKYMTWHNLNAWLDLKWCEHGMISYPDNVELLTHCIQHRLPSSSIFLREPFLSENRYLISQLLIHRKNPHTKISRFKWTSICLLQAQFHPCPVSCNFYSLIQSTSYWPKMRYLTIRSYGYNSISLEKLSLV